MTGPSSLHVAITLITVIGLGALPYLLYCYCMAGVAGESSVNAAPA